MSNRLEKYQHILNDSKESLRVNNSKNLDKILRSKEILKENSSKIISFSRAIISSFDVGAIFPSTINVIQGKKGVHKSRLTETLCCTLLSRTLGANFLGFKRDFTKTYAVLYVDTERNIKEQFPYAIQKIKEKSGYEIHEQPPNFDYISLIDISRNERFETLKEYLQTTREKYKNSHLFIVMDVITDCIENFNDPKESMKLVDLLNETINNYDVTFLCVIHENPNSGDKARGHLGTEIINKASQVMQIGFEKDSKNNDTELIRLKFLHCRSTRKLDTVYLRYSDEAKGLVIASGEEVNEIKHQKQEKASIPEIQSWLSENMQEAMPKKALIANLKDLFDCGERTIEDRIKELVDSEFLSKNNQGREVFYSLTVPF
jgi:KaiC/GvpD/RAD55 family RecA-like ATPase